MICEDFISELEKNKKIELEPQKTRFIVAFILFFLFVFTPCSWVFYNFLTSSIPYPYNFYNNPDVLINIQVIFSFFLLVLMAAALLICIFGKMNVLLIEKEGLSTQGFFKCTKLSWTQIEKFTIRQVIGGELILIHDAKRRVRILNASLYNKLSPEDLLKFLTLCKEKYS